MSYTEAVNRAGRHGWAPVGVIILGNTCYTTLHRWQSLITIAIHPVTLRMFRVR